MSERIRRPLDDALLRWLRPADGAHTVPLRPLGTPNRSGLLLAGDEAPHFWVTSRAEEHRLEQIRQRLRVEQQETMPCRRPSGDRPRYDGFVAAGRRRGSSR